MKTMNAATSGSEAGAGEAINAPASHDPGTIVANRTAGRDGRV